jgi:hypothetical protein
VASITVKGKETFTGFWQMMHADAMRRQSLI